MSATMSRKVIISGMLGNGLEWYDYALYGHMALVINKLFFPNVDPFIGLLATYGTFAAGFVSRPIGAILFGYIGDTYGRRAALAIAILMMAIPTGLIGLLPTYAQWGVAAPICLVLIRILQGLSLGGEFSGAITYMVEHSPQHRRAVAGSMSIVSLILGFVLGSLVATAFSSALSVEDFESWGWRVPFLFGIVIGVVGFYIRSHCAESPMYEHAKQSNHLSKTPVRDVFTKCPVPMLQAFAFYLFVTMPFYTISIYFIAYTSKQLGQPYHLAMLINALTMMAMLVSTVIGAFISDRVGRKKVMMASILIMLVLVYPAFQLMQQREFYAILIGQTMLGFIHGIYLAPIAAVLVELFPTRVRYTGMALSYNLCAILGGFTPMISTWLINYTGHNTSIMYIIVATAVASMITLLLYRDRWREPLAE